MPQQYCYAGYVSEIGGKKLSQVGQALNLTQEQAEEYIRGGCVLIPKETFDEIGFTDDELRRFGGVDGRGSAPQEFLDKLALAVSEYDRLRAQFE